VEYSHLQPCTSLLANFGKGPLYGTLLRETVQAPRGTSRHGPLPGGAAVDSVSCCAVPLSHASHPCQDARCPHPTPPTCILLCGAPIPRLPPSTGPVRGKQGTWLQFENKTHAAGREQPCRADALPPMTFLLSSSCTWSCLPEFKVRKGFYTH